MGLGTDAGGSSWAPEWPQRRRAGVWGGETLCLTRDLVPQGPALDWGWKVVKLMVTGCSGAEAEGPEALSSVAEESPRPWGAVEGVPMTPGFKAWTGWIVDFRGLRMHYFQI